jgi:hypothetical protein
MYGLNFSAEQNTGKYGKWKHGACVLAEWKEDLEELFKPCSDQEIRKFMVTIEWNDNKGKNKK